MARRISPAGREGAILVLSDGCFPQASALASEPDVRFVQVGTAGDNVAVTNLKARRCLDNPLRCQILAEVTSYVAENVQCNLRFMLEDNLVRTVPIELEPAGHWQRVFEIESPRGGRLVASLDRADTFPVDNKATTWLRSGRVHGVVVSGRENVFLTAALKANPMVELASVGTDGSQYECVRVIHREIPDELPKGPLLIIDPNGPCDLWSIQETLAPRTVTEQRKSSLLSQVSLIGLNVGETRPIIPKKLTDKHRVWASNAGEQPVVCTIDRPDGRVWVFSCNLDESDLVERTTWPVLLANALDWLDPPRQAESAVGRIPQRTPDQGPEALPEEHERSQPPSHPDGAQNPEAATETAAGTALAGSGPPGDGESELRHGVMAESDIRVPDGIEESDLRQPKRPWTPLWTYFAGFALIGVLAEWCLFQRRWIC
jgi:hypothetical protein